MAKIMGLVVTGTERQGRLVQVGEIEAKGQKGKVQVRRESPVWTCASSFFVEFVWVGGHFTKTFPDSLTMLGIVESAVISLIHLKAVKRRRSGQ